MFRSFIFSLFLLCAPFVDAGEGQKVCLNMIVKDESQVICRCLDSVIPLIDYWVIVDTGSTDGTQEIIQNHLKDIPGELYELPWKNFGASRTEAFQLAEGKGDYILLMDADDTLEFKEDFKWPLLTDDLYNMWRGNAAFSYLRPQLIRGDLPWKWVGVTHEYLACDQSVTTGLLKDVRYVSGEGGASYRDPKQKFQRNVDLLTEGLKEEPDNVRYVFYLAESYRDLGDKSKALECYLKRIKMGGWDEELFWSKLQTSIILRDLGMPSSVVAESFRDTHQFRPHRAEPVYYLAELYNNEREYEKAYDILKSWVLAPKPKERDGLFNMDWMQKYGLLFQLSICSYYVGRYEESLQACDKLLAMEDLPSDWRSLAESNRNYPIEKLAATQDPEPEPVCEPEPALSDD